MSWDVVVFKLKRKVDSVDEINKNILLDIGTRSNFKEMIQNTFPNAVFDNDWCKIENEECSLETSMGDSDGPFSNTIFHLYGEATIYPLIHLCKKYNWQAYDTALDSMIDLETPEINGYEEFNRYLNHVFNSNNLK